MPSADLTPTDGLPMPRRAWAVLTIALGISMSVLDGAIANVALPTIARELGASAASSIWIVNAYQLAITVCLLPFAALGERLGYRRVYLTGMVVFAIGSLGCVLADSLEALVVARIVQGFGAAGLMSISSALTRFNYPQKLLGRGIGLNAVVISISAAAGPTLAALIMAIGSWHWLFAINLPIALVAITIGLRALPYTPPNPRRFDVISAILNALAFGGLILGAESVVRDGLMSGLSKLAVGAVAAVFLARRELHRPAPLVPFDLLRIPIFSLSIVTSIASFAAQMLTFVALPFYFQGALGRSPVETGLLMTPWPLAVGVAAPIAGRLADRYAAGLLGGIGLIVFAIGLALLSQIKPDAQNIDIIWRMAICGLGFGFFQSPNNRTIISAAPRDRSGAAGGMLATGRLLGQTTGAVTMAVFFHIAGMQSTPTALITASAIAGVAAMISFMRLGLNGPKQLRPNAPVTEVG